MDVGWSSDANLEPLYYKMYKMHAKLSSPKPTKQLELMFFFYPTHRCLSTKEPKNYPDMINGVNDVSENNRVT